MLNIKTEWEKEAQKWLDELSILDLEMVNGIIYYKIQEAKKEVIEDIENFIENDGVSDLELALVERSKILDYLKSKLSK